MNGVAYTRDDEIHVSVNYVQGYLGDVKTEITGVWDRSPQTVALRGLIEGVADFSLDEARAGKPVGSGIRNGFVAELNKKIRNGYSADYFVELLGKTVDQLWSDYKTKYSN
ncbi:hypothetical protein CsSME_00009677 [Camellia sinensis var. sinensis]